MPPSPPPREGSCQSARARLGGAPITHGHPMTTAPTLPRRMFHDDGTVHSAIATGHLWLLTTETCLCHQATVFCLHWFVLLLFSHSVASDSLQPCGLQHTRLPCPSPPGLYLTLKKIFFSFCIFLVALGLTVGHGLSLVVASRGTLQLACAGFSL